MMTYTIVPTAAAARAKAMPVPMKGSAYDYTFLRSIPKGSVAAIRVPEGRKAENIRRAVQITTSHRKNTSVLDNVLLVW